MESLLLFCRALASPTMCRFIPALSVPQTTQTNVFRELRQRCPVLGADYFWLAAIRPAFRFILKIWGGSCVRRNTNADRLDVHSGDCYDWRGRILRISCAFLAVKADGAA